MGLPKRKSQSLGRRFLAILAAQAARHALLQRLHDGRRRTFGRLADQQVNVIGHDNVARERKSVAVAHLA